MSYKLISIIVPVYNEEKNIPFLYDKLIKVWDRLKKRYDYEIIFINDGSTDKSAEVLEKITNIDKNVKYLTFSRNFGKEIATSAGIHHANGAAAVIIDADLQHPPELIPVFITKWQKGAEVVVGVRNSNKGESITKKVHSFLFYKIINLISETKIIPKATDYRLIDRIVIDAFNQLPERNRITRGLIDWLGFNRDYVYFHAGERRSGKAAYSTSKLIKLALSTVVSFSLLPLKLAGYLGVVITFLSGALGMFVFIEQHILNDPLGLAFSGTASLAVLIMFLIGIILCALGLIALYIANIHNEVTDRPLYVIKKKKNFYDNNAKQT